MLNLSMVETIARRSFDWRDVKTEHGSNDSTKLFQSELDEAINRSGGEEANACKTWQVIWIEPTSSHGQKALEHICSVGAFADTADANTTSPASPLPPPHICGN